MLRVRGVKAFEKVGWKQDRQKGSHVSLTQPNNPVVLTVPLHRELKPGLLRGLIRSSGMSIDEFAALL